MLEHFGRGGEGRGGREGRGAVGGRGMGNENAGHSGKVYNCHN